MNYNQNLYTKAMKKPILFVQLFWWLSFLWFFIGPINYLKKYNGGLLELCIYIVLYYVAFGLGYGYGYTKVRTLNETPKKDNKDSIISFLTITVWINLIFTFLNALQYSYTTSISGLIGNFIAALTDPGVAYFEKILTMQSVSTSYSVLTYITVFLAPVLFPTQILSAYYFKDMTLAQKIAIISTFLLEIFRWTSVGTNKGLMDIAVLFGSVFFFKYLKSKMSNERKVEKKSGKYLAIAIVSIVAFICVFGYFLSSRSTSYPMEYFQQFPYSLVPEGLRSSVYKITSYLCQGFQSMRIIIGTGLEWKPTYGIGNSTFLLSIFYRLTGIRLSAITYQTRVVETGLVASGAFQSVYSYFANDLSFPGVTVLMFVAGKFFCRLFKETLVDDDPVSMTLLYMMILACLNASCLNYMLSFSNMCVGFWSLVIIRLLKKRIRFSFIKIKIKR